jgi:hypothetical protein
MKKLFVWDPGMRSTAKKFDPCVIPKGKKGCDLKCEDCRITLISDRFLGEEFHRKTLGKYLKQSRLKYAYVIIADVVGCNLNCWFCYAWKFLNRKTAEKYCKTAFVTPERLAEQFYCKFKHIASLENMKNKINEKTFLSEKDKKQSLNHINLKLPIKRIRISGGEPIFNNQESVILEKNESFNMIATDFWLKFFEELDKKIGLLKKEEIVNISEDWSPESKWPICLAEVKNKLTIRFDTNGTLFAEKKITERFVKGIFKLYKEGKLNHLFIQIDYSIKGATPKEFFWSQSQQLPIIPETNKEFRPENHPQYNGYYNLINEIEKYSSTDKNFDNVLDIFAERGINHDLKNKLFLNYGGSLDWQKFSKLTGINFSEVDNPLDLNFGWNFSGKMHRYANRGAILELSNDGERIDTESGTFSEIRDFRWRNINSPEFKMIISPVGRKVNLKERESGGTQQEPSEKSATESRQVVGWLLSGNKENWEIALNKGIWGLNIKRKSIWNQIKTGDILLFYVTQPLSRIIGYARVVKTFEGKDLIWPDEQKENELKYSLRILFESIKILPLNLWTKKHIPPMGLQFYHGINPIHDKDRLMKVIAELEK